MKLIIYSTIFALFCAPVIADPIKDKPTQRELNTIFFSEILHRSYFNSMGTSHLCTLETCTDDPFTYIHIFHPNKSVFRKVKCSANLANLAAIDETTYNLITQTRKLIKYQTPQKLNPHRGLLHTLLPSQMDYNGPIIQEYLQKIPLWIKLQSGTELKHLISYLQNQMIKREITPPETKPLLFISLEEDPLFTGIPDTKMLTGEEINFLESYFMVVKDREIIKSCHDFYQTMMDQLNKIENMNYPLSSNSFRESIIYGLENNYKSVGIKEMIFAALAAKGFHLMNKIEPTLDSMATRVGARILDKINDLINGDKSIKHGAERLSAAPSLVSSRAPSGRTSPVNHQNRRESKIVTNLFDDPSFSGTTRARASSHGNPTRGHRRYHSLSEPTRSNRHRRPNRSSGGGSGSDHRHPTRRSHQQPFSTLSGAETIFTKELSTRLRTKPLQLRVNTPYPKTTDDSSD